jgi:hypothetical protein
MVDVADERKPLFPAEGQQIGGGENLVVVLNRQHNSGLLRQADNVLRKRLQCRLLIALDWAEDELAYFSRRAVKRGEHCHY